MDNPYAAPQGADDSDSSSLPPDRERLAKIGEVFVAWERLRIWYNVALGAVAAIAVLLVEPRLLAHAPSLEQLVAGAIGANACYFAGPLLEGYVTWWWRPARWLRMPVFVLGTLASCLVTLVVIALVYDQVAEALG